MSKTLPLDEGLWEIIVINLLQLPFFVRASVRMIQIVVGFITGDNVSLKSKSNCWWQPLATSLALYLFTKQSGFSLTLEVYLHPTSFLWGGKVVRVQVWLAKRAWYSTWIALNHSGYESVCLTDWGSTWVRNALDLEWSVLALVSIGWALRWRTSRWVKFCIEGDKDPTDSVGREVSWILESLDMYWITRGQSLLHRFDLVQSLTLVESERSLLFCALFEWVWRL